MRPRLSFLRQWAVFIAPLPLLNSIQGQALGATLRAAVAVQIVCPDNLSLNRSARYAFGRRRPLA